MGQESDYFCWPNSAIFQGINTVYKRFISLIHKKFEAGPKIGLFFHKLHITENTVGVSTISYIHKRYLKDIR